MNHYKEHTHCRVCNSNQLSLYLDLGKLPLSNNLCSSTLEIADTYPLQVYVCNRCGLSQLSIVVEPEVLFGHYVYRSSINKGYIEHCRQMSHDLKAEYHLTSDSYHIDIAGNDGALLKVFKDEIGLRILNVDPAKNLAAIAMAKQIPTLTEFWSKQVAKSIVNGSGYGKADLVTATNVFAHVDDVKDFMYGIKTVLKPDGVCILEFPYLLDFIDKNEFDTIYFEHLSYFSIRPLKLLCEIVGINIMKVEKQHIHGGSVRVHIGYGKSDGSAEHFISNEASYGYRQYKDFRQASLYAIRTFSANIGKLRSDGATVAGFAASAKGNTLLNCARVGLGSMRYIVDETPEKIGKFSPGTNIPIVSMLELESNPPDYLVVLSWNFFNEIAVKCRLAGYRGKFIIPIPYFQVVD